MPYQTAFARLSGSLNGVRRGLTSRIYFAINTYFYCCYCFASRRL